MFKHLPALLIAVCSISLIGSASVLAFKYRTPEKTDGPLLKAKTLLANEEIDQALLEFRRLTKAEPKNYAGYQGVADCLYYKSDYAKAMEAANTAIELNPRASEAFRRRGKIHDKLHEQDASIADYTKALEISPTSAIYLSDRADVYFKKGDLNSAAADLSKYISLVKKPNPMIFYTRSVIYTKLGKKAEADADRKRGDRIINGEY